MSAEGPPSAVVIATGRERSIQIQNKEGSEAGPRGNTMANEGDRSGPDVRRSAINPIYESVNNPDLGKQTNLRRDVINTGRKRLVFSRIPKFFLRAAGTRLLFLTSRRRGRRGPGSGFEAGPRETGSGPGSDPAPRAERSSSRTHASHPNILNSASASSSSGGNLPDPETFWFWTRTLRDGC